MGQFRDRPTLHQAATLSGIPGKMEVSGDSVAQIWLEGKLDEIVAYNEFDAFTTHLLWARVAHFSGLLTPEEYTEEQNLVRELLESESAQNRPHLRRFIEEWERLLTITGQN
jgi:predicted PolB exonuclease-like 3'-5' exonuclease